MRSPQAKCRRTRSSRTRANTSRSSTRSHAPPFTGSAVRRTLPAWPFTSLRTSATSSAARRFPSTAGGSLTSLRDRMERQYMLARGRYVVADPAELPAGGVLEHGAVVIDGDRVVAVGGYDELRERHPEAPELGSERHVILPGLVNAHQHGQGLSTIQLGLLDDFLEPWAAGFWARCHPLDIYLDTLYAAARMIRAGVTTAVHFGYGRGLG